MNIYVGNLSSEVSEEELRNAFNAFGPVGSLSIVRDEANPDGLGHAFVVMLDGDLASSAIDSLNGRVMGGYALDVHEIRPEKKRVTVPDEGGNYFE